MCARRGTGTRTVRVRLGDGEVTVWNDGEGIPVVRHSGNGGVWLPQMLFGSLLTGSNFDDRQVKFTGGRNGYGAKLANIFSAQFTVRTRDAHRGLRYEQRCNLYAAHLTRAALCLVARSPVFAW